jgi:ABC-2 type transport system ATP-binding protein
MSHSGGWILLVRDEVIEGLLERASEATILVSSHDLAEIENLASHIGYLDQGYLRLSEEMTTLADRFREVELTFDQRPLSPAPPPGTWIQVSTSASVLRFVETRFNEERTTADIRRSFGDVRNVTFTPMSLRSIFLAMAKTGRDSA